MPGPDQLALVSSAEQLDLMFAPERASPIRGLFRIDEFRGQSAARVACASAGVVLAESLGRILRDTGIERAVGAAQDVDVPGSLVVVRGAGRFRFPAVVHVSKTWESRPPASFGSNHVDFGGMSSSASATAMSCSIVVA